MIMHIVTYYNLYYKKKKFTNRPTVFKYGLRRIRRPVKVPQGIETSTIYITFDVEIFEDDE